MSSQNIAVALRGHLSSDARILLPSDDEFGLKLSRWGNLRTDIPAAVVLVKEEKDVLAAVRYGITAGNPFRATSGGHGIGSIIKDPGFIIDLSEFNGTSVDTEKATIDVQGGATFQDVSKALAPVKHITALGSANAVGLIPAILGGGIAAGQGAMGLICDNLISARIVTKRGELVTASESENEDLFWGLRGGGQKFGIVTQVTLRIYPSVTFGGREDGLVWSGFFAFSRDKLRSVIEHWNQHGRDDCSLSILFAALPPTFEPTANVMLVFFGSDDDMKTISAPFVELGPVFHEVKPTPYEALSNGVDPFCIKKAGKKAFIGTGLSKVVPETLEAVWDSWVKLITSSPDFAMTTVMTEIDGEVAVKAKPHAATAFAHRDVSAWAWAVPWFSDPENKEKALQWANEVKALNRSTSKLRPACYANFGTGEEPLEELYGESWRLERLQALKEKWDPEGVYGYGNYKTPFKWSD